MFREEIEPWKKNGARAATWAGQPWLFIRQHLSPLLWTGTNRGPNVRDYKEITSEEQFWGEDGDIIYGAVRLKGFRVTDWFPRTPGVYWSEHAQWARRHVWSGESHADAVLGRYYSPEGKMSLIEEGGVGTIRLRPRKIDGEDCWLATALTGIECHRGIPLAIPDTLLRQRQVSWGDRAVLEGRTRFLEDAGLDDTAAYVHHARPLIVFVESIEGIAVRHTPEPIIISPVALFEPTNESRPRYEAAQYTFVQCAAGIENELDAAVDWIQKYATRYEGRVITNFDQQRPSFANAPLSYQRLVTRTYDRAMIQNFDGTIRVDRIDQLIQASTVTQNYEEVHMGHNISAGGSAIINIDSQLTSVTQTLSTAPGLNGAQKSELEALVQALKADLDRLKASHTDEVKEITDSLEKIVVNASKPPQERKKGLLQLAVNGLKDAAELVKDVAPSVLTVAGQIAKFVGGL